MPTGVLMSLFVDVMTRQTLFCANCHEPLTYSILTRDMTIPILAHEESVSACCGAPVQRLLETIKPDQFYRYTSLSDKPHVRVVKDQSRPGCGGDNLSDE